MSIRRRIETGLKASRHSIAGDRKAFIQSATIRGDIKTLDKDDADIVADYDTILASIEDALAACAELPK